MGLFGRDDRTTPPPSSAPPVTPDRPPARPQTPAQARTDEATLIGRATRIEGKLTASNDVQVNGELKGMAEGAGQLLVAEGAKVEAVLHARALVVAGTVIGDVSADDKVELKPSANLRGNITAPRIVIQDGATFEGQVFMQKPEVRKAQPTVPTPAGSALATQPATESKAENGGGENRPGKPRR